MSEAFERYLLWLSPDRDLAIQKHGEIMQKMARYFIRKACLEAEDLAAETRDRVIKIIAGPIEYPNPEALFYSVARKIWLEETRKPKPEPLPEDHSFPAQEPEIDRELQVYCLHECLGKLPRPEHELITSYYEVCEADKIEGRSLLAASCGGKNSLRIKTCRIRSRLRICIERCIELGEGPHQ